jgi:Low molecular weight phosphotyrosine protein phosphatase
VHLQGDETMNDPNRRIFTVAALAFAVMPAIARSAQPKPPTVLFVCEFGTAKSAIARELFRKRARARGIAVTAFSRGLKIEDHIAPPLRDTLDAEGIDPRRDGFAVLSARDVRSADIVVTFTPLPYPARTSLDWSDVPSVNDRYAVARADLDRRIDALLDTIAARKGKRQ